jgi:DNA-binding MarR family transcriptional regulator
MIEDEATIASLQKWNEVSMHHSMQSFFRYAKVNNISMSQVGTLFHLSHKGTLGVTDISERLGVTSAAASQMLDRLVQNNLLERSEDPNDRRVRQIRLTPQGHTLLAESLKIQQLWIHELVDSLSAEERDLVKSALDVLIDRTRQLAAHKSSTNAA